MGIFTLYFWAKTHTRFTAIQQKSAIWSRKHVGWVSTVATRSYVGCSSASSLPSPTDVSCTWNLLFCRSTSEMRGTSFKNIKSGEFTRLLRRMVELSAGKDIRKLFSRFSKLETLSQVSTRVFKIKQLISVCSNKHLKRWIKLFVPRWQTKKALKTATDHAHATRREQLSDGENQFFFKWPCYYD